MSPELETNKTINKIATAASRTAQKFIGSLDACGRLYSDLAIHKFGPTVMRSQSGTLRGLLAYQPSILGETNLRSFLKGDWIDLPNSQTCIPQVIIAEFFFETTDYFGSDDLIRSQALDFSNRLIAFALAERDNDIIDRHPVKNFLTCALINHSGVDDIPLDLGSTYFLTSEGIANTLDNYLQQFIFRDCKLRRSALALLAQDLSTRFSSSLTY